VPRRTWVLALLALLLSAAPAAAQGPFGPLNDLFALGQGGGQTPDTVPTMRREEPPFVATPRATCGPGSKPEPDIQGRVPRSVAGQGLHCNVEVLAHQGKSGGFKTLRYIDETGRECAYYDTTLLAPLNAFKFDANSLGVAVLDMTDPAHPVQTDSLTELPMLSPHESVVLNQKRGLIAAVLGNPSTYPGLVSIYDASKDCRHPVLQSTSPLARYGHESGFAPDGRTFYAAGTAVKAITAIDVTDPKAPHDLWEGNVLSHGLSISDDGNRAYVADATGGDMLILDTSEIQAREPDPQAREISRLTWTNASIPQNAIPFTRDGHPYVLEFDEYTAGTLGGGDADAVGAGHIVDIADETQPKVVANLRLQVNQPADHAAASGDPGQIDPAQGYAAHYCGIPSRVDPLIVACSFISSGLRVFDISDITHPKEIAYFVAPETAAVENGLDSSNFAMSQPVLIPERKEIWYSDGPSGFYAVRLTNGVWPTAPASPVAPGPCRSRRAFAVHVRLPKGARVRRVKATVAGKRVRTRRAGRYLRLRADLRGLTRKRVKVVVRVTLRSGRSFTERRTYRLCAKKRA
jgi:hypothetical protein